MNAVSAKGYPTIVTRFGYSPLAPAIWRPDAVTGLQYRDLSLAQASGDAFSGRHLRTGGFSKSTSALSSPQSTFIFLFVLAGRVRLETHGQPPVVLGALDSAVRHGPGGEVNLEFSHDAEIVELKSTESGAALFGTGQGSWVISHEAESSYHQGEGPRAYFRYRDLGIAEATARRIHIHVVRSTKALDGGTGWHSHSMGQLFYVLRGWADLAVDRQPAVRMSTGDAMCISERMKHNVPAFSADYLVLEMCIPADYDTVDAPAP